MADYNFWLSFQKLRRARLGMPGWIGNAYSHSALSDILNNLLFWQFFVGFFFLTHPINNISQPTFTVLLSSLSVYKYSKEENYLWQDLQSCKNQQFSTEIL